MEKINYIARDKNGQLFISPKKPTKCEEDKVWDVDGPFFFIEDDLVDKPEEIKWEDEEPKKVVVSLELLTE